MSLDLFICPFARLEIGNVSVPEVSPSWRTSSYSGNQGNCVEVALDPQIAMVRDTKDRDGGTLGVSVQAWKLFVQHADGW